MASTARATSATGTRQRLPVATASSASLASQAQSTAFVPRTLKLPRPVPRTPPTQLAAIATRTATEAGSTTATTTTSVQNAPVSSVVWMVACSPADVPASVDVYMSAFGRGPFTYWWPPRKHLDDGMRAWQERRFANRHTDERSVQLMAILVDCVNNSDDDDDDDGAERQLWHNPKVKTEDVVAYAKWTLPSPELSEDSRRHFENLREALLGGSSSSLRIESKGAAAETGTANSTATTTTTTTETTTERVAATSHGPGDIAVSGEDDSDNEPIKSFRADHPTDLPEGTNAAYYEEFFGVLERLGKKWRLDEMLELSLMCTRPSHHGYGIAAAMIRSVLDIADREGICTILLGMELATPLYRRLGFETVETAGFELARREAGEDGVMHVMIRQPRVDVDG